MFVKSFMKEEVTYRKSAGDTVLKPMTVTFVDEKIVSAEELKGCYGDRIAIIPADKEEEIVKETAGITDEAEKEVTTEEVKDLINTVKEMVAEEQPTVEIEGKTLTPDETVAELDDLLKDFENDENDNIPEVKDFLEGETNKLPEGTEIISDEEAKKLEETKKVEPKKATKKNTKNTRKKNK